MNRMHNSQFRQMLIYFSLAVSVIAFYWVVTHMDVITGWFSWIMGVMGPFIGGFIIAYVLSIPAGAMQRLLDKTNVGFICRGRKVISIVLVYLLFVLGIYWAIRLLVPPIIVAITDLINSLPGLYQMLLLWLDEFNYSEQLPFYLDVEGFFVDFFGDADISTLWGLISYETIISYLGTILGGANVIFRVFLAFISSIYFLFEGQSLARFLKRMMLAFVSKRTNIVILSYGQKINQYFKKYIFCLLIDCIVMAIVGTIILWALGSPYFIFLGLMIGVMNLIPYFGSIIATVVAIIVVWFTQSFAMGVLSTVILLTTQQLDANVLQPRLYGTSLKLSPLLVIISVSVGGAIGGVMGGAVGGTIMGMIVAIPCAKVIMNILDDVIDHREKKAAGIPEPLDTTHGRR